MSEDPRVIRRSVRKRITGDGVDVDVAADVNAVVATGSAASASSVQHVRVVQGRRAQTPPPEPPTTEED